MSNERADLIATLRYDECDEGCKQPCKLSQQTRDKAADMLERDGEKIAALISWRDDAVLNCARRRCGRREERIAELEAEMARELIAARQVIEAVAALLDEWDDAAYCTSCGIRQCETGHGDEHHDGCKRTAVEHALRPLGRRG